MVSDPLLISIQAVHYLLECRQEDYLLQVHPSIHHLQVECRQVICNVTKVEKLVQAIDDLYEFSIQRILITLIYFQSPFGAGQAETPPPAYSPRDDQGPHGQGPPQGAMNGGPSTTNMMDTGSNQVMDTTNSLMHSEPVPYEVKTEQLLCCARYFFNVLLKHRNIDSSIQTIFDS